MNRVAIVVLFHRDRLTRDEQISLFHLQERMSHHHCYLLIPDGLQPKFDHDMFTVIRLDPAYFRSTRDYSRLLISEKFYRMFRAYEYILIYQFDCLVFEDRLDEWCDKGYDYIGAPWFRRFKSDHRKGFLGVGNGGFSLRRVESCIDVLNSWMPDYHRLGDAPASKYLPYLMGLHNTLRFLKIPRFFQLYQHAFRGNEDYFWSYLARLGQPDFRIPGVLEALDFAFEGDPSYCFSINDNRLPFGCHAWNKFDRSFWSQFLIKQ